MASTYLSETTLGTATDATKFTFSAWVKTSFVGAGGGYDYQLLLGSKPDHANSREGIWIWNNNELAFYNFASAGASAIVTRTSAKLRDLNGWYHIVVTGDASQSGTDKLKFYINGELQTEFDEDNRSNFATIAHGIQDTSSAVEIGGYSGTNYYLDGYMSHVHFTDGYAYAASTFGSTDATTGEWKINTSPSVTYGNNGFFILKDGNSVTDQSGNSNNFTVAGGTLTKSEDCPSNVFVTWNALDNYYDNGTFSNGNTTYQTNNSNYGRNNSTLGMTSGKFYWEIKPSAVAASSADFHPIIGITSNQITHHQDFVGKFATDYGYGMSTTNPYKWNNNTQTSWGTAYAVGDIVGVALDLDNNKIYFSKNGTFQESGDPTSGSTGTGSAYTITAAASTPLGAYFPSVSNYDGTGNVTFQANFGNGYFGTTAITSEGTNASGNGKFEYDVPTGYTALSTKGLNL